MISIPSYTPDKDTIIIGASPAAALIIGLSYGAIAWSIYTDITWLGFTSLFPGGIGLEMACVPRRGKHAWHAVGILLLGLAITMLGLFLFYTLLPESIALTVWGTAALHAALTYLLYTFIRRLLPVHPPHTSKHST